MRVNVIPRWHIGDRWQDAPFAATIETSLFVLGIVVHTWGLRLLLFRWHLCIHWRPV